MQYMTPPLPLSQVPPAQVDGGAAAAKHPGFARALGAPQPTGTCLPGHHDVQEDGQLHPGGSEGGV